LYTITIKGMKTRLHNTAANHRSSIALNATFGFDAYDNQVKVISSGQTV